MKKIKRDSGIYKGFSKNYRNSDAYRNLMTFCEDILTDELSDYIKKFLTGDIQSMGFRPHPDDKSRVQFKASRKVDFKTFPVNQLEPLNEKQIELLLTDTKKSFFRLQDNILRYWFYDENNQLLGQKYIGGESFFFLLDEKYH